MQMYQPMNCHVDVFRKFGREAVDSLDIFTETRTSTLAA